MKTIKKIGYILIVSIVFIIYLGLKELKKESRKERIDNLTNQIIKNPQTIPELKQIQIGTSSFKMKSPFSLVGSNFNMPEEYKNRMEKLEVLEFENNPYFKGKATFYKWTEGVSYDLDLGLEGAMENIRKLPGVEKVLVDKKYYKNTRFQSYFFETAMFRYKKTAVFKGVILKSGQETILLIFEPVESKYESIITEIINSIKENS